jgi:2-iminobutanoate/2-iminopropanoate deaminase
LYYTIAHLTVACNKSIRYSNGGSSRKEPSLSKRRTITVPGYVPANPIPCAARKGPLLITGAVEALDPETQKMATGLEEQVRLTFHNLERILAAGGAGWNDVIKLDFAIGMPEVRGHINDYWLRIYPDPEDRPARQVRLSDVLPAGALLQCVATAWID